ncbi:MAG: TraB/GumN family protein [Crocinitomicaceae bacterium]
MKTGIAIISLVAFYILSCSSVAEESTNSIEEGDDIIVEDGNSLLWRIEGNNCVPSYMYGTMHMIDEEYYDFTDVMRERIEESETIIMEVGGMPNPLETFALMSLDTGDVTSFFTKEQMSIIVEFFDTQLDTDPEQFYMVYGKMKPFFILQSISQSYFKENSQSYDLEIMGIAAEKEIPLIGFETIQEQLGFFDKIPTDGIGEMIVESIENFEKEKKQTQKMMKIYSEQKVDKLIPLIQKQSPEFMEFSDLFLYDRNKAWIPTIKKEIADKQCFIAVGAAHLFGERGVIDLLEKEGYTVTAISTKKSVKQ